jgi:capsular polysaccharide biosynthesis protein
VFVGIFLFTFGTTLVYTFLSPNPHKFSFSDVRVIDEGRDGKLIKPNVKLNLALGVLVGLVLGVGGILLVEHLNFNKEV